MTVFDPALRVADAVLFEGYLLYPYRASAAKNQVRWQFGVLMPPSWTDGGEPTAHQAEVLLEPDDGADTAAVLHVRVRFLHVQAKSVERAEGGGFVPVPELTVAGERVIGWDEAVETGFDTAVGVAELFAGERTVPIAVPGERIEEALRDASGATVGRIVRERRPLDAVLRLSAQVLPGPYVLRVRARVENRATPPVGSREEALRHALVAAHTVLAVDGGEFLSLLEPPEWARPIAAGCENVGVWPVLIGGNEVVLASPIILYDFPSIAPESPGELHDGLEIDEILSLRTMALTDEEKREARATDPRAAAIIDRVDAMPPEVLDRLHGAIRYLRGAPPHPRAAAEAPSELAPWWDPGSDTSVSPETDAVTVNGVPVARGSRVVLRPRHGRTDAQDMFLDGRTATVAAVLCNVDDEWHLAVTPDDDPEATEVMLAHGRYLYFAPDEVEPLEVAG
jgi:hypothetical protein